MRKALIASILLLISFASHPPALLAQNAAVGGPMLGYVSDPAGGIRPILGIPGAATVGARQVWGSDAALVEVSPAQDYALTVDADGAVARVMLGGTPLSRLAVEGALKSPERIVMSPAGRSALLVRGARAQVIASGAVTASFDLGPAGQLTALAVSDDGQALAAGPGGVYLFKAGEARLLPVTGAISALAFTRDGRGALAAGPGQLAAIEDVAGTPAWRMLAALDEDFGSPAVVADANGRAIVAGGVAVLVIGRDGSSSRFTTAATTLSRLNGNAFRLTGYGAEPMWMIEVGSEPRLLFIPPAAEGEEVAQ